MGSAHPEDVTAATLWMLEDRVQDIAWEMVARFQAEVPGWARHRKPGFLESAQEHCVDHVRAFLTAVREQRTLTRDELGFVVTQAELRARQGVPLQDMLDVYRIGNRSVFHAVVEAAATSPEGSVVALVLMDRALPHTDTVTALFTESYLMERQRMREEDHGALLDLLEAADGPPPPTLPGVAAGHRYAVAVCGGDDRPPEGLAESLRLVCGGPVAARAGELVAVIGVEGTGGVPPRAAVEALLAGTGWSAGVSLVHRNPEELADAYREARVARRGCPPGRAAALDGTRVADYLAATADATARRLVDPDTVAALEADRAAGGVLAATLLAFAEAGLGATAAAAALGVHPNTVHHRLDRLRRRTGRNPRSVPDLLDLLLAVRMLGAPAEAPGGGEGGR